MNGSREIGSTRLQSPNEPYPARASGTSDDNKRGLVNCCLGVPFYDTNWSRRESSKRFTSNSHAQCSVLVLLFLAIFGDLQTVLIMRPLIHTVAAAVASRRPVATGSAQLPVKDYRIEVTECDWRQKDPSQGCSVSSACFSFEADVCVFCVSVCTQHSIVRFRLDGVVLLGFVRCNYAVILWTGRAPPETGRCTCHSLRVA